MANRSTKKEFYPKGTQIGKRAILFHLAVTNGKEIKAMNSRERASCLKFLKECRAVVDLWLLDFELPFPGSKTS